ncbi:hypothetical protein BC826DRAFT_915020 [Russula brevipes]|nr:hypothetical protein BC826DRAFT_915020 [Russula brevipes]
MENPTEEIERVVQLLTRAASPDIQEAAIRKYFARDASFRHPMCSVASAPNSREGILGIFQWYNIMSTYIDISVDTISTSTPSTLNPYDPRNSILFLDMSQVFRIKCSPFSPARTRLLTRLKLRQEGRHHYIASQEDFFHPDDFFAAMIPPLAEFVGFFLRIGGFACGLSARLAQAAFGLWRPRRGD